MLAAPGHETIVHAGREELLFCLAATGRPPHGLFDVQIAAGLVGFEYPAGYGSLMSKLLGQRLHKGETRTDWRRRPLSTGQIEYALDDVRYLERHGCQAARPARQSWAAQSWMDAEMAAWKSDVEATRSRRTLVEGLRHSGLSRRSLAIVRELWRWRKREAERRDCPTRRVLRDDLIIELAKRRSADLKQIRAVRGMERGDLQRCLPQLAAAIERALAVADDECPVPQQREASVAVDRAGSVPVVGPGEHLPLGRAGPQHRGHGQRRARPGGLSAWDWPTATAANEPPLLGAAGGPKWSAA